MIDACNSGQALEAEEKRRGPMNSKALAQLAYEKGIRPALAALRNQPEPAGDLAENGVARWLNAQPEPRPTLGGCLPFALSADELKEYLRSDIFAAWWKVSSSAGSSRRRSTRCSTSGGARWREMTQGPTPVSVRGRHDSQAKPSFVVRTPAKGRTCCGWRCCSSL